MHDHISSVRLIPDGVYEALQLIHGAASFKIRPEDLHQIQNAVHFGVDGGLLFITLGFDINNVVGHCSLLQARSLSCFASRHGKTEGQSAEGKSGTDENASGKSKTDANAEGKGDHPGKSARLESHDVSKVRTYFSQHRPSAQRIERNQVSVSIGVAIPSAIVLYDLPPEVIVVSGPCPIKYFVWEADVVLVDSCTHEVVEIIPGVAQSRRRLIHPGSRLRTAARAAVLLLGIQQVQRRKIE